MSFVVVASCSSNGDVITDVHLNLIMTLRRVSHTDGAITEPLNYTGIGPTSAYTRAQTMSSDNVGLGLIGVYKHSSVQK